jgi:putative membrane protein insertion efficiency factor
MIARFLVQLMILCVRAYQVVLAPLFNGCCRFEPSCSNYCIEALRLHGPLRGLALGVRRLLRCHPFGPCGPDPVPPPRCCTSHTSLGTP